MTHLQLSISRKNLANPSISTYSFFFRTDWMEPDEALLVLEEIKRAFFFPRYKITVNERTTTTTQQELT